MQGIALALGLLPAIAYAAPLMAEDRASVAVPPAVEASPERSRWTVSLEAVSFTRSNGTNQVLVSRLPGATTTFQQTQYMAGAEAFNAGQFDHGYTAGPRITVGFQADALHRLELSYLGIRGLKDTRTTGPDDPVNWYVMRAPGFWQTQDFYYQGMTWASKSDLQNLEANVRRGVGKDVALLAGVRWLQLKDSLQGTLSPGDSHVPTWKTGGCASDPSQAVPSILAMTLTGTADACASGGAVGGYPPFWTTTTTNDFLGLQAGVEGTFARFGALLLSGVAKAGLYANRAKQEAAVSMQKQMYYASARRDRMAFAGQSAIEAKYAFSKNLSAKLGYELLWLNRVALAPGQIDLTLSVSSPGSVTAAGVNMTSSVLLQGFTLGLEYQF